MTRERFPGEDEALAPAKLAEAGAEARGVNRLHAAAEDTTPAALGS